MKSDPVSDVLLMWIGATVIPGMIFWIVSLILIHIPGGMEWAQSMMIHEFLKW